MSVSNILLLNGANACAVQSEIGAWEVLQFHGATELSAGRWRLNGLVRGQAGTLNAMSSGALIGARFVLLDAGVKACNLAENETDIALNWKVGPSSKAVSSLYFNTQNVAPASRSLKANAPVHLKAKRQQNGDTDFSWIRCGAQNADSWDGAEIPLSELNEAYEVIIRASDMSIKRASTIVQNQWTYSNANRIADFGAGLNLMSIDIAQVSANGLAGLSRN